jgi:hypothetical protein
MKRWWQHYQDVGDLSLKKFRMRFQDHYGNLGKAWRLALDKDSTGRCCHKVFCRVCNSVGIVRHLQNVWTELTDGEITRNLTYRDFDPEGDVLIQQFVVSLTLHGGSLTKGWLQLINDHGGRVHRDNFIEQCEIWNIGIKPAKWLFSVLDPHGARFLTQYDELDFLALWDPGDLAYNADSLDDLNDNLIGDGSAKNPFKLRSQHNDEPFDLHVTLTKAEHDAYQKILRTRQMIAGVDTSHESREGSPQSPQFALYKQTQFSASLKRREPKRSIAGLNLKVEGKVSGPNLLDTSQKLNVKSLHA